MGTTHLRKPGKVKMKATKLVNYTELTLDNGLMIETKRLYEVYVDPTEPTVPLGWFVREQDARIFCQVFNALPRTDGEATLRVIANEEEAG